jgi:Mg2+ and Co2+ transporter CorA
MIRLALLELYQAGQFSYSIPIVSTIFLPLSFIAGMFGASLTHTPTATYLLGFNNYFATSVLIGLAMLIFFRSRQWFLIK